MALIICHECGKEYSNKAQSCPACGCPTIYNCLQETDVDSTNNSPITDAGISGGFIEDDLRKKSKLPFGKKGIITITLATIVIVGILAAVIYAKSDANIKRQIVGTWIIESVDGKKEGIVAVSLEFYDDGSCSFMLNGEASDSRWKLKKNKKLWVSFGNGNDETYNWGNKESDATEWYISRGVLRLGNSEFRKTDEDSSKAKKDIEVRNKLMEAAKKTALAMDYDEYGLCFVIQFENGECKMPIKYQIYYLSLRNSNEDKIIIEYLKELEKIKKEV